MTWLLLMGHTWSCPRVPHLFWTMKRLTATGETVHGTDWDYMAIGTAGTKGWKAQCLFSAMLVEVLRKNGVVGYFLQTSDHEKFNCIHATGEQVLRLCSVELTPSAYFVLHFIEPCSSGLGMHKYGASGGLSPEVACSTTNIVLLPQDTIPLRPWPWNPDRTEYGGTFHYNTTGMLWFPFVIHHVHFPWNSPWPPSEQEQTSGSVEVNHDSKSFVELGFDHLQGQYNGNNNMIQGTAVIYRFGALTCWYKRVYFSGQQWDPGIVQFILGTSIPVIGTILQFNFSSLHFFTIVDLSYILLRSSAHPFCGGVHLIQEQVMGGHSFYSDQKFYTGGSRNLAFLGALLYPTHAKLWFSFLLLFQVIQKTTKCWDSTILSAATDSKKHLVFITDHGYHIVLHVHCNHAADLLFAIDGVLSYGIQVPLLQLKMGNNGCFLK